MGELARVGELLIPPRHRHRKTDTNINKSNSKIVTSEGKCGGDRSILAESGVEGRWGLCSFFQRLFVCIVRVKKWWGEVEKGGRLHSVFRMLMITHPREYDWYRVAWIDCPSVPGWRCFTSVQSVVQEFAFLDSIALFVSWFLFLVLCLFRSYPLALDPIDTIMQLIFSNEADVLEWLYVAAVRVVREAATCRCINWSGEKSESGKEEMK